MQISMQISAMEPSIAPSNHSTTPRVSPPFVRSTPRKKYVATTTPARCPRNNLAHLPPLFVPRPPDMPPHKHAGDYKCRAMAQAVKEYINAFPLHERKAAITALFEKTQDEREAFLAERVAAIREAAQGKGWQCYPCTPETCPTQKRGWKTGTSVRTPVSAVNWGGIVGFPLFENGFSGLCCPAAPDGTQRCVTSAFAKDGTTRLGSGGGADDRGNKGQLCMCQCSVCIAMNCANTKSQGIVQRPHWVVDTSSGPPNKPSTIDYFYYEVNITIPPNEAQKEAAAKKAAKRAARKFVKAAKKAAKVAANVAKKAAKAVLKKAALKKTSRKKPSRKKAAPKKLVPKASGAVKLPVLGTDDAGGDAEEEEEKEYDIRRIGEDHVAAMVKIEEEYAAPMAKKVELNYDYEYYDEFQCDDMGEAFVAESRHGARGMEEDCTYPSVSEAFRMGYIAPPKDLRNVRYYTRKSNLNDEWLCAETQKDFGTFPQTFGKSMFTEDADASPEFYLNFGGVQPPAPWFAPNSSFKGYVILQTAQANTKAQREVKAKVSMSRKRQRGACGEQMLKLKMKSRKKMKSSTTIALHPRGRAFTRACVTSAPMEPSTRTNVPGPRGGSTVAVWGSE